jgi:beta-glucosidase
MNPNASGCGNSFHFIYMLFQRTVSVWLPALFLMLSASQGRGDGATNVEARITALISQMTLAEKVGLCQGLGKPVIKGIPRLHLPDLIATDGPSGPHRGTAFPSGVAFGATWNPNLLQQAAAAMGEETRADGATMLLGPGVNIQRDPLGGRFFEYYTEDPLLDSRLAVAFVKGVQSKGVAACVKHFLCNNREQNRNNYMSIVSQRALREIYFPAFKASVEEGGAWAVMTSANGVNGEFVSDSRTFLHDTLKGEWGFDGLVRTDGLGTRSTVKAALAGLDVSVTLASEPLFGPALIDAVKAGPVPESVLDDKVRRVLRTMSRTGLLDGHPPTQGGVSDNPAHHALSRQMAEESLVLLKNEHQTLPLDVSKLRKLLVVGPNADRRFYLIGLGGSSWQDPSYEITPLQGIRTAVGTNVEIQYFSSEDLGGFEIIPNHVLTEENGRRGFMAKYFNPGKKLPVVARVESELNFVWEMRSPELGKVKVSGFRAEFSARIIPPVSGTYALRVTAGAGSAWMFADPVGGAPLAVADAGRGIPNATANVQMQAGRPFFLRVAYTKSSGDAACRLEWSLPKDANKMTAAYAKLAAAAKSSDAVLIFAGIDHSLDSEGCDRATLEFPQSQEALIQHVVRANPKTIVTLINGSPLELGGWLGEVPAVLEAWYPGMEGGNAIAAALFGRINPSGKLPFTWPKHLPAHRIGIESNDRIDYKEGVFVGYRYFDTAKVEPQFPFGFGLSYTTFAFSHLKAVRMRDKVKVRFDVTNTGTQAGAEVAQVYVAPPAGRGERPVHELEGFQKIFLPPGNKKTVELELDRHAFAYFDEAKNDWLVPPGGYEIQVGDSSQNLPLSQVANW